VLVVDQQLLVLISRLLIVDQQLLVRTSTPPTALHHGRITAAARRQLHVTAPLLHAARSGRDAVPLQRGPS